MRTARRARPSPSSSPTSAAAALLLAAAAASPMARAQPMPESVLPGRPDAAAAAPAPAAPAPTAPAAAEPPLDANGQEPLDPAFTSDTAGITIRPPAGGTMIRRAAGTAGDEVVRFVNDQRRWRLVVSRIQLTEGVPLAGKLPDVAPPTTGPAGAAPRAPAAGGGGGFTESVAAQMPNETPGRLVRSELMPINGYEGAVLASRYRDAKGQPFLMQQALIRRTDKLYYVVTYATPLTKADGDVQADPLARRAVDTFERVTDSIQLIDQAQVKQDQDERLIRTRSLLVNWTPERLTQALEPEQWLRLIKDGKDIGYTYVVEETANDLPRAGGKDNGPVDARKALGVRIGVRSRTLPEAGVQVDAESWMWVSFNRGQESFSNVVISNADASVVAAAAAKAGVKSTTREVDAGRDFSVEAGTSVRHDRVVPRVVPRPGGLGNDVIGQRDEKYEVQVMYTGRRQSLPPIRREAPPFYVPQALVHLLPRLVPLTSPKTYLFASYVPDLRDVYMRYIDVLPAQNVALGGRTFNAIPVRERIGLEGSATTHYVSPDGKYLGSVNEDAKITIVATDQATLLRLWKDAKIERPGDVNEQTTPPTPVPATPAASPRGTR